jgi:hypothetical protein
MMRIIALSAVLLAASVPRVANACEPGPRYLTRPSGVSVLLAIAVGTNTPANGVRVNVLAGHSPAGAVATGPAILVPWAYGKDCKPLQWPAARAWPIPNSAAVFTATARPRDRWIGNVATFDVYMAELEPMWSENLRGYSASATDPLLTPAEFFDFSRILPTSEELERKEPSAFKRLFDWESAHQSLAVREPARSALSYLRWAWSDMFRAGARAMPTLQQMVPAPPDGALWNDDRSAAAASTPAPNGSQIFVFIRQKDGAFLKLDASSVEACNFGVLGRKRGDYDRYETVPIEWMKRPDGVLQVRMRTRAWRLGQRYTVTEPMVITLDRPLGCR